MPLSPRAVQPTASRFRLLFLLPLLAVLSCTDGSLPLGYEGGEGVPTVLMLSPTLVAPSGVSGDASLPINRIRLTAFHAETGAQLGQSVQEVDPGATSWELPLEVGLTGEEAIPVVVLVEMIHVGSDGVERVVFSGRTGVIQARPGGNPSVSEVPMFPGDPGNLSITAVEIAGAPGALTEGASAELSAVATGAAGEAQFFWSALDPGVLAVGLDGVITGVLPGVGRVAATAGPRADTVAVTVTPRVDQVEVTPGDRRVEALDEAVEFTAEALDPRGAVIPGVAFDWRPENPAVAEHLGGGVFRTLGPGSTEVVAEVVGVPGVVGQAELVVEPRVAAVTSEVEVVRLDALGATAQLTATPRDRNGFPVAGAEVTWTSPAPEVVEVDETGVVTAVSRGTVEVEGRSGEAVVTVEVEVAPVAVAVLVAPSSLLLQAVGATGGLEATPVDANGHAVEGAEVAWASTVEAVATAAVGASPNLAVVTAVSAGTIQVTASVDGVAGSATVMVEQEPANIVVTPASATLPALGLTTAFSAVVTDANGNALSGATVTWGTSNAAVATVSPTTGVATATGNGTASITASFGGVTGSATLTVAQVATAMTLTPATLALDGVGSTGLLTAAVVDGNGQVVAGAPISWLSRAPGVATVAAGTPAGTGVVTAISDGTAVIQATSGTVAAEAVVTVTVDPGQVPDFVIVSPDPVQLTYIGAQETFTADVRDAQENPLTGIPVVWTSDDEAVVTVGPTGEVLAVGVGGTYVWAETANGAQGSAWVEVIQVPHEVSVTPDPVELTAISATQTLTAEVRDFGGTVIPEPTLAWGSTDTDVATVVSSGLLTATVTAVAEGTARAYAQSGAAADSVDVVVDVQFTIDPYEPNADLSEAWDIDGSEAGELNAATGAPGLPFETVWDPGPGGFNPDPEDQVLAGDQLLPTILARDGHALGVPYLREDSDVDWFQFQVTSPGIHLLRLHNRTDAEGGPGQDRTALHLVNATTEEERTRFPSSGPGVTSLVRAHLEPGIYAARVDRSGFQSQPLPFTLEVQAGGANPTHDYLNGDVFQSLEPNDFSTFAGVEAPGFLPFEITGNDPSGPGPYFQDMDLFQIPDSGVVVEVLARAPNPTTGPVDVRVMRRESWGELFQVNPGIQLNAGASGSFTANIPMDGRPYFVEVTAYSGGAYDLCVREQGSYCYGDYIITDSEYPRTAVVGSTVELTAVALSGYMEDVYPGARIVFSPSAGTMPQAEVIANGEGEATAQLTLPGSPGLVTVEATIVGAESPAVFEIMVLPDDIQWVAGSEQAESNASNLAVSADGLTWYEVLGAPIGAVRDVAYGETPLGSGKWVAVGGPRFAIQGDWEAPIVTSVDGVEWIPRDPTGLDTAWRVAYGLDESGDPMWVAIGDNDGMAAMLKSSDGVSWNPGPGIPNWPSNYGLVDIAFGDSLWVVVTEEDSIYTYNVNAPPGEWSSPIFVSGAVGYRGVSFNGSEFVATGEGGFNPAIIRSTDGANWFVDLVDGDLGWLDLGRIRWDGTRWLMPHVSGGGRMLITRDGRDWTNDDLPHTDSVRDVTVDPVGGRYVSAGRGGFALATTTDGETWTGLNTHWETYAFGSPWATAVAHRTQFVPFPFNRAPRVTIIEPSPETYVYYWSGPNIPLEGTGQDEDVLNPADYVWIWEEEDQIIGVGPVTDVDPLTFNMFSTATIRLEVTDPDGAVGVDRVQIYVSGC